MSKSPNTYADLYAEVKRERPGIKSHSWHRAFLSYLVTTSLFWVGCGLLLFALAAWVWGC